MKTPQNSGFTLVEILIVVIILGILFRCLRVCDQKPFGIRIMRPMAAPSDTPLTRKARRRCSNGSAKTRTVFTSAAWV